MSAAQASQALCSIQERLLLLQIAYYLGTLFTYVANFMSSIYCDTIVFIHVYLFIFVYYYFYVICIHVCMWLNEKAAFIFALGFTLFL